MPTIPATSLRSKYLKSLPINTIYLDKNGHKYQVQEKRINQTLTKVGVNYFGEEEAIQLPDDLDPKHLKTQNTNRISIMTFFDENSHIGLQIDSKRCLGLWPPTGAFYHGYY
jgi:hypothetical protein